MRDISKVRIVYSVLAIILMAFGIGIVLKPEFSFMVVCRLLGVILLVYGIVKLLSYFTSDLYQLAFQFDFAMGIFSMLLGIVLIVFAKNMMTVFPTFIGIIILVDAVFKMQTSLDAKRFGLSKWWCILILAILVGIAGGLLIIKPIETSKFVMTLLGLNFILDGLLNLWVVLYTVKK